MRRVPYNPALCRRSNRAGFTIIESVVAMAIVAMMLVAAIHAAGAAARHRGVLRDRETGLMLAQDLLSEIVQAHYLEPVDEPIFGRESGEVTADRTNWDDVDDYDGLVELPPRTKANEIMEAFATWQREVVITPVNPAGNAPLLDGVPDQGVRLIEVAVISPGGAVTTLGAMRADLDALRQQPTLDSVFVSRVGITLQMAPESAATAVGAANVLNHRPPPPDVGGGP